MTVNKLLKNKKPEEVQKVIALLDKVKDSNSLLPIEEEIKKVYKEIPVSPEQFFTDPYYLGFVNIYDVWRKDLYTVLAPDSKVYKWVLRGATGAGKSFTATLANLYLIYKLIMMKNPQEYYGMAQGTPIIFGIFSITKYQATDVVYDYIMSLTCQSPFFRQCRIDAGLDPEKPEFPNKIKVLVGSTALHALGANLFSCIIDEANFRADTDLRSAITLYNAIKSRMESRFSFFGEIPGLLCLVSSEKFINSFIEKHTLKGLNENTYVSRYALWEAKPERYSGQKFYVQIGDSIKASKILEKKEDAEEGLEVIDVPIEHRESFEFDIESAIRDLAGKMTYGGNAVLITNRERVYSCICSVKYREHPFTLETITLPTGSNITVQDYLKHNLLIEIRNKINLPLINSLNDRFVHIDLSLTGDCTGIAMCHNAGDRLITRYDNEGLPYESKVPIIFFDFMLRIKPLKGTEIDLSKIRAFIVYLFSLGFNIQKVTLDGYQSRDTIQILSKLPQLNDRVELLSVDRDASAYLSLKNAIYEGRIDYYNYEPFITEILNVQINKNKVDHPIGGSKDVSDAVAGSFYSCLQYSCEPKTSISTNLAPIPYSTVFGVEKEISEEDINERVFNKLFEGQYIYEGDK